MLADQRDGTRHAGYQASTCPEAAAVTVDALHAAVAHEELCKHLLLGTHQVEEGLGLQLGFDTAIKSLQGNLTAQLTAAACWARMYSQVKLTVKFLVHRNITFLWKRMSSVKTNSKMPGGHSQASLHFGNAIAVMRAALGSPDPPCTLLSSHLTAQRCYFLSGHAAQSC